MWTHADWALGVWGGVAGAALLLMRKGFAVAVLANSFAGAVLACLPMHV